MAATVLAPWSVHPATADTIQSEKARAAQLAAEIQAQSQKVNRLAESYDLAQIQANQLAQQLAGVKAQVAASQAKADSAKASLVRVAVDAYVTGGSQASDQQLFQTDASQAVVGQGYLSSIASDQQSLVDQYTLARQQLAHEQTQLAGAQAAAAANAASLQRTAQEASAAAASEQATLNQVNGRIATLVAQLQAQEEAQRRAAAEAAARAAAAAAEAAANAGDFIGSAPRPAPAPSAGAQAAVNFAYNQIGKPYEWGASGPDSYDCSGLTMASWEAGGVSLPHYTVSQYDDTYRISADQLQPGDLVFWDFPGEANPGHVGIYVGGGNVVVADHSGAPVREESMYFDGSPMGFGRVG
ncbi:MAG TPA: C40 family peptidase [Acidimicrobiales bacterium]|nr:C40 family peptidase [Acidimicrobiales bacterium]